jgi:nitrous oxidase accessory protein
MRIAAGRSRARAAAVLAAVLLVLGAALPLWSMTLHAPQYPQGLRLVIDGRGAHGDVDELNALNHYIGMRPIDTAQFPERRLFYPAVAVLATGLILSPLVPWRWLRLLVALGLLAMPIVFLADLQWRLHQFGHSLDPAAAFRLPAFTPLVLGPTEVMNFNVTAKPGIGLVLLVLGAMIFVLGTRIRVEHASARLKAAAAVAVVGSALVSLGPAAPSAASPLAVPPSAASPLAASPSAASPSAASPLAVSQSAASSVAASPSAAPATAAATASANAAPPAVAGVGPAFNLARTVEAAPPGAVVEVPPGRHQGPLVITKPITLIGIARPTIDGGGRGDVVVIDGDDVRLEGFVIRGSALAYSREASGIVVRGARAVVRGNRVEDVLFGVYLSAAEDALIENNTIITADLPLERRGHAIYLWKAQRARLLGNRVLRGKDGIYISFSHGNLVEGNLVSGCRYGIHYMYSNANTFRDNLFRDNVVGSAVMYSADVTLVGNAFEGSRSVSVGVGLIFKDADRLLVRGNRIVRNRIALEFDATPASLDGWVRVERNLIAFNEVGFSLMSTAAITATENTVVENLRQVQARGAVRARSNQWSFGGRGNYWGDYTGFDATGDGVGDLPYRRTDLLEALSDRAPALRAFLFTPAHLALEAAARIMPLVRAEPVVEDRAPLMRPVVDYPAADTAAREGDDEVDRGLGLLGVGLALLVPSAAAAAALGRPWRRP